MGTLHTLHYMHTPHTYITYIHITYLHTCMHTYIIMNLAGAELKLRDVGCWSFAFVQSSLLEFFARGKLRERTETGFGSFSFCLEFFVRDRWRFGGRSVREKL